MKFIGFKRLAGLALAAAVIGGPFAGPALAQNTTAPAAPAAVASATPEAAAAAPAAAAAAPAAAAPTPPKIDTGDTAWMLTSSVLVLMMTIPGLALFYAGMVRKKNILATLAQSFAATALITVLWMIIGYSLAFTDGGKNNAWPRPSLSPSTCSSR
jgi:Amt family ammonium transporter